jgi:Holliday junction resolvase-like predicted endonuclease
MSYGRPARAVGSTKQKNIVLAAQSYLRQHPENTLQPRIDVIEIYLKKTVEGAPPSLLNVHHIRNAFLAK